MVIAVIVALFVGAGLCYAFMPKTNGLSSEEYLKFEKLGDKHHNNVMKLREKAEEEKMDWEEIRQYIYLKVKHSKN